MRETQVVIDTEEIAEYLFTYLLERGYVPEEEVVNEIADIVFDYLLDKCVIDEIIDE